MRAEIVVPGSKSITNRALILAALADGETTLRGALWSEDTEVMVNALQKIGFSVKIQQDTNERRMDYSEMRIGGENSKRWNRGPTTHNTCKKRRYRSQIFDTLSLFRQGCLSPQRNTEKCERPQAALLDVLRKPHRSAWMCHSLKRSKTTVTAYNLKTNNNKLPIKVFGEGPKKLKF